MDIPHSPESEQRLHDGWCSSCRESSEDQHHCQITTNGYTLTLASWYSYGSRSYCSTPSIHRPLSHLTLRRLCTLLLFCTFFSSAYSCGPGRGIGGPRKNRKLTPLVFKEHVPNMSEKTLGGSGLSEGRIRRDSPTFKDLVPNYNKDIIFKDEEGTGADRLMSRRCKEKLNILAVSVMNQWPGVRLRVTEGWDEDNVHGEGSLHYEGRAVDITTSDRDRSKYGMLARLAVEAGFDWVYYESRAHIHCSVKSDSTTTLHVNGCFTPDSSVIISSGLTKRMRDLRIGDRVLSVNDKGETIYSEVILFMDRDLEQTQQFVELHTQDGAMLRVTPAHLVMVWNSAKDLMDYIFADRVEEGDFLFVHDDRGQLRPQRVVKIDVELGRGVIAPLTREGTIVVNSVAASCYAIIDSQTLAHWSMAPMRFLSTVSSWLPMGSSCSSDRSERINGKRGVLLQDLTTGKSLPTSTRSATTNASIGQEQNGIHWYAKTLYRIKDYVVPKSWRYQ